ncbi:MAG: putative 4-hydroxybenzoate polyprenyltransferase [Acidobacteria bacterium]|nr:putative 4-hydroxybenzoate polyprenyltransferase [Acidobacteriota bacterium]
MLQRLKLTLDMIKFEHSVFALPFALTGALLAVREDGFVTAGLAVKLAWIVLAMVGARSAAMAFNRLLDQDIDARNPRTATRHLPAGLLGRGFAWAFTAVSAAIFLLAAWRLNELCLKLAPLALAVVMGYSYTKRFTSLSHVVLGIALGIAPSAAWVAIRGSVDWRTLWLTAAVMLWTAGFDIIYSCQDTEFDRRAGLFSLPSRLGTGPALMLSRVMHLGMLLCLAALVQSFQLGGIAMAGVALVAALLAYEQSLVKPNDFSRVNAAFFTVNGYVSVLFFFFWAADILWEKVF